MTAREADEPSTTPLPRSSSVKGQRLFIYSGEVRLAGSLSPPSAAPELTSSAHARIPQFHPWRLPVVDLWRDVLEKAKASGNNAISCAASCSLWASVATMTDPSGSLVQDLRPLAHVVRAPSSCGRAGGILLTDPDGSLLFLRNPSEGVLDLDGFRDLQPFFDMAKESASSLNFRSNHPHGPQLLSTCPPPFRSRHLGHRSAWPVRERRDVGRRHPRLGHPQGRRHAHQLDGLL